MIAQWDLFKVYQEMGERSEHIKRKNKFKLSAYNNWPRKTVNEYFILCSFKNPCRMEMWWAEKNN